MTDENNTFDASSMAIIELNALRNRVRGLEECRETHDIRKFVGERPHEKRARVGRRIADRRFNAAINQEYNGDLKQAEAEHDRLVQEEADYGE